MGKKTSIAWTDSTWNPMRGCSRVSEGCRHCYAERMASRFSGPGMPYEGLTRDGRWTGMVRTVPDALEAPLRWTRRRRVFVNSMSDLFHENVSEADILAVFDVMRRAHNERGHIFQVLTKRPARMLHVCERLHWTGNVLVLDEPKPGIMRRGLPGVWLGVSVEDQATAEERIPLLLQTPARVRFVSAEPLLGPLDLRRLEDDELGAQWDALDMGIDWVIVGGESGPQARPCRLEWARSIVEQCRAAECSCFVKQLGSMPRYCPGGECSRVQYLRECHNGTSCEGDCSIWHTSTHAGAHPAEWPPDLRVRQFPAGMSCVLDGEE